MKGKEVLYAKWLNGEISDDELRAVAGDDILTDLDRLVNNVDQWSMPKYDAVSGYEKFKQNKKVKPAKIRKINWFAISGIAASFLVLLFIGNQFLSNQDQVTFANNGKNENKIFADGSEIWLNDGSTITHNEKKWSDQRTIELTGEAMFEVTKGNSFVVNTQNGSIRVLGTQFNVRAWGSNLYVECYEGKVEVKANNQKVILIKNEAINVVLGNMNEKQVITNLTPSWQNSTSRFYNENLQQVFKELERQYDIKVNISATDRSFSGNFRHDNLENALKAICKPLGLKFTIGQDDKVVDIEG